MDVVIPAAVKDYTKLKYCIEHIEKNVFPKPKTIYLFTPTKINIESKDIEIKNFLDTDVINYDRQKIKYRPNWQYAMYLKMFQDVTKENDYLVVDSDHILISNFNVYENNKPVFFLTNDQNAEEYFNFSKKIFNIGREYDYSFISEIMLFKKDIVEDMLSKISCNRTNFFQTFEEVIDRKCHLAEYELYGNYVEKYFPNMYEKKKIKQLRIAYRWHKYEKEEVENLINNFYKFSKNSKIDSIRIDTYDPPT